MTAGTDPIAILLAEHEAAYRVFDALTTALDACDRDVEAALPAALAETERTLRFLSTELETHIAREEAPLFMPLKAALPADDRLIEEMLAEHDQARMKRDGLRAILDDLLAGHDGVRGERDGLAAALAAAIRSPEEFGPAKRAARAVLRTLQIHFQNEEEIVFPLAQQLLSAAQLADAATAMLKIEPTEAQPVQQADHPEPRVIDIAAELARLRATPALERDGRTATTLLKDGPLRILLVALREGGQLHEHPAPGRTGIQVLEGDVTLHTGGASHRLAAGQEILLAPGQRHTVDAHANSALLLHFAPPA